MQLSWNDPTAIMFAIYLVAMLGIGALGYLGTKNLSDYILGGRSLGSFVTALSAGASDMSGWLLMGLPGAVYVSGLSEAWIAIGLVAAPTSTGVWWRRACACTPSARATPSRCPTTWPTASRTRATCCASSRPW